MNPLLVVHFINVDKVAKMHAQYNFGRFLTWGKNQNSNFPWKSKGTFPQYRLFSGQISPFRTQAISYSKMAELLLFKISPKDFTVYAEPKPVKILLNS